MSEGGYHVDTTAKLVRMVNQIEANLRHDKDPVATLADHIHAFWTEAMKKQVFDHGTHELGPVGAAAFAQLARGIHPAHQVAATDPKDHGADGG
ncbi:formate dehydrogenase subunit delta [Novosphingobium sp.]|uniref:formate dehydrogenase subunit delta n=1 Tax=Novosphingobium sp. TaxID=1874826 RepID=UPI003B520DA0